MTFVLCPVKRCQMPLKVTENSDGTVTIEDCPQCFRRRQGLCKDCNEPVYGTIGKAIRCELHAELKRAADAARHRNDPDVRKRINARNRKKYHDPQTGYAAKKKSVAKAWAERHPDRARAHSLRFRNTAKGRASKRRYELKERVLENKRERARTSWRRRHPEVPHLCAFCGQPVEWSGHGRPPKYCNKHRTPKQRREATQWATATSSSG